MFDLLSIVVTGHNDAEPLGALLRRLRQIEVTHEVVYCDIESTDESLRVAQEGADRVFRVENVNNRRAAGRWVGAKMAEFDWILFLDADMQLEEEFIDFLNNRTYMHPSPGVKGFVGSYHLVENGVRSSKNIFRNEPGSRRAVFEGALLVQTEPLMAAGNWDPALYANGAGDLWVRLAHVGCRIEALPLPMVTKLKPERASSNVLQLTEEILPINRNWLGFGQLVASQIRRGTILDLLFWRPWPLLLWAMGLACLIDESVVAGRVFLLMLFYLAVRKGPKDAVRALFEPVRAPFGMLAYRRKTPKFEQVK